MSGIHAFMKRDWFTCSECGAMAFRGLRPYCRYNKRPIDWPLKEYGCGSYSSRVCRRQGQ